MAFREGTILVNAMTIEELIQLPFVPAIGELAYYPGGWPMPKHKIGMNFRSVYEIEAAYYCQAIDDKEELLFLKHFVLYYIFAPVFNNVATEELREKLNPEMSLDEILDLALEYGMDPL